MRFFAVCVVALLGLCASLAVVGEPALTLHGRGRYDVFPHAAYFLDPSTHITLDQILSSPNLQHRFRTAASPVLSFPIQKDAVWVKLILKNPTVKSQTYFLQSDQYLIDHQDVFVVSGNKLLYAFNQGLDSPFMARAIPLNASYVPLDVPATGERTVYLRAQADHAIHLNLSLLDTQALFIHLHWRQFYFGLYFGIVLVTIIFNAIMFIFTRIRTFLLYVAYVIYLGMFQLSYFGYSSALFWSDWTWGADRLPTLLIPVFTVFVLLLTQDYLQTGENFPRTHRVLTGLILANLAGLAIGSFIDQQAYIYLTIILGVFNIVVTLTVLIRAALRRLPYSVTYLLAWSCLMISGVVLMLLSFALVPFNVVTQNILLIGSALEMILVSISLANRFSTLNREKDEAQKKAIENYQLALTSLRKADQIKDEILANVSHELRTPLNGILGIMEHLLRDVGTPEKTRRQMEIVMECARSLSEMVTTMLTMAKFQSGTQRFQIEPFSILPLVNRERHLAEGLLKGRPIRLQVQLDEDLPMVWGDAPKIEQVLNNLIGNACKFTAEGEIRISAKRLTPTHAHAYHISPADPAMDYVLIGIEDTGVGIPPDRLKWIFERFNQLDSSPSRRYEGSGLGLSIAKLIVESHWGSIGVQSIPGKGSVFYFTLPTQSFHPRQMQAWKEPGDIRSDEIVDEPSSLEPVQLSAPDIVGHNERILVVDDSEINREVVGHALRKNGYQVVEAASGKEALEKIKSETPVLIVLDLMMPEMSGYDVTKLLKEDEAYAAFKAIPIMMLTAKTSLEDKIYGLQLGADDYLGKPFSIQEFLARVHVLLRLNSLQNDLYRWNRELSRQVEERSKETRSLQQRVAEVEKIISVTQVAITVNHRLNSPLMSVLISAQQLSKLPLEPGQRKYVDLILQAAQAMREVIRRLREVTKPIEDEYVSGVKMVRLDEDHD
jgi:signal transduction histidine kinase